MEHRKQVTFTWRHENGLSPAHEHMLQAGWTATDWRLHTVIPEDCGTILVWVRDVCIPDGPQAGSQP